MPPIDQEIFYAEIAASTATLADLAGQADPALPVPACPGWTLRQLVTHVVIQSGPVQVLGDSALLSRWLAHTPF